MLLTVFNVFYILIAIAMIVLILLQRGAGADAGSGFGGGASATVFGARGSANFLSRTTAVLAGLFFLLSLGMGIYLGATGGMKKPSEDLGVMSGTEVPATTTDKAPAPPPASGDVPQATAPAAAAPASDKPAVPAPVSDPAAAKKDDGKPGATGDKKASEKNK
jgi:preprotein translocase subunit SecG